MSYFFQQNNKALEFNLCLPGISESYLCIYSSCPECTHSAVTVAMSKKERRCYGRHQRDAELVGDGWDF